MLSCREERHVNRELYYNAVPAQQRFLLEGLRLRFLWECVCVCVLVGHEDGVLERGDTKLSLKE